MDAVFHDLRFVLLRERILSNREELDEAAFDAIHKTTRLTYWAQLRGLRPFPPPGLPDLRTAELDLVENLQLRGHSVFYAVLAVQACRSLL